MTAVIYFPGPEFVCSLISKRAALFRSYDAAKYGLEKNVNFFWENATTTGKK